MLKKKSLLSSSAQFIFLYNLCSSTRRAYPALSSVPHSLSDCTHWQDFIIFTVFNKHKTKALQMISCFTIPPYSGWHESTVSYEKMEILSCFSHLCNNGCQSVCDNPPSPKKNSKEISRSGAHMLSYFKPLLEWSLQQN